MVITNFLSFSELTDFALVGIHTEHMRVYEELQALEDVYNEVVSLWDTEDILILGDFNAGSNYIKPKRFNSLALRDSPFNWLIPDDMRTDLGKKPRPYDR